MTGPILSPNEIATFLLDSGLIDKATANRLEKRIVAYGDTRENDGHKKGVARSVREAAGVTASIKAVNQRTGAQKVWRAIELLLPNHGRAAEKEAYARGFKDGSEDRSRRQWQKPDAR